MSRLGTISSFPVVSPSRGSLRLRRDRPARTVHPSRVEFESRSLAVPSSEAAFRALDLDRLIEVERGSLGERLHCTETGTSCAVVGRRQRRGAGRQRETPKDRTRRVRIGDGGKDSHSPATSGTAKRVDLEDALKEFSPGEPTRRDRLRAAHGRRLGQRASASRILIGCGELGSEIGYGVRGGATEAGSPFNHWAQRRDPMRLEGAARSHRPARLDPIFGCRNHPIPPTRTRRQHPVVSDLMGARRGKEEAPASEYGANRSSSSCRSITTWVVPSRQRVLSR